LIALDMTHYHLEERFFHFAHDQIVEMSGLVAVQGLEITLQSFFGLRTQGHALAIDLQVTAVEGSRDVST